MKAKLFYSYCHEDKKFRVKLEKSLANLNRKKIIVEWKDRDINSGDSISKEIKKHIESSDIILLLFSPDFINSESCYAEIKRAFELKKKKGTTVIPIILKPCDWMNTHSDIKDILALPTDAKAITKWNNQDEAWLNITNGTRNTVTELKKNFSIKKDKDKEIESIKKEKNKEIKKLQQKIKSDSEKRITTNGCFVFILIIILIIGGYLYLK